MDKLKIIISQQDVVVGDIDGNLQKANASLIAAQKQDVDLVVFSELFLSGYPPEDLLLSPAFIKDIAGKVEELAKITEQLGVACLVGAPIKIENELYNTALLLEEGKATQTICKQNLPNYDVFDEARLFASGSKCDVFNFRGVKIAVRICEDIWQDEAEIVKDAQLIIVINGSPYEIGKTAQRLHYCKLLTTKNNVPLIYTNQIGGQDELVFDGASFVMSAQGNVCCSLPSFAEVDLLTNWKKTNDSWACEDCQVHELDNDELENIWQAIVLALRDYTRKNNFKNVLLGLSGGIDSALVLALACDALGEGQVNCVFLPSRYTSAISKADAIECAKLSKVDLQEISIAALVSEAEAALSPLFENTKKDTTEENLQSRIRGLLLMALSNKFGAMLLSTGNKSEISVGYATLYGDMNGGFNPIKDIYKMQVYEMACWRNAHFPKNALGRKGLVIPQNILDKEPSAELRENQKDKDSLPPYEVLDDILQKLVDEELPLTEIVRSGHNAELVKKIADLVKLAEYKRRQAPPGVRISKRNFGKARRYPITNAYNQSTKND